MPSGSKKRKAAKKKEAAHHHQHNHNHHHHPHSADVHSHGDDDLKHHDDDKESDTEEVSSPVSQEHPNKHHQFTDGEKEEVVKTEDSSDVQASSKENKSFGALKEDNEAKQRTIMEKQVIKIVLKPADVELNSKDTIVEDFERQKKANGGILLQSLDKESVVQTETDSKSASDEVSSKNEIVENVESRKEENDGVLLQSRDEGSVVRIKTESKPDSDELNCKTAFVENVEPQKETTNEVLLRSIEERSVVHMETDSRPTSDELSSKNSIMEIVELQKEANGGSMLESLDLGSVTQIEADLKTMDEPETMNITIDGPDTNNITAEHAEHLKESTDGDLLQSQHEESRVIDKTILAVDNAKFFNSSEAVHTFSEGLMQVTNSAEVGENHSSPVETRSANEMEQVKLSDENINGNTSVPDDSNGEMKGNAEKEVILQEKNGRMLPACVGLEPDNRGGEAIVKTDEIVAASDAKISASLEIGEKLTVSYNVPATETAKGVDSTHSTNCVEHLKDPEAPKPSDCQPLVPSAPRVAQRTSWMSCCGLFEVFARSN